VSLVRLKPLWMTNHPPSVLWHYWLGHQTCKNRRTYNLYCVGADNKPCSINQSLLLLANWQCQCSQFSLIWFHATVFTFWQTLNFLLAWKI